MIRIVTDAAAGIPAKIAREYNIETIPMFIQYGGKEYEAAQMDVDAFYTDIYNMIDNIPTSSQPSAGDLEALFEPMSKANDEVLGIFISSHMSGTIENAYSALTRLKNIYPDFSFRVIDSTSNSYDEAFPVLNAVQARDNGATLDECAQVAAEAVKRCKWLFTPESLRFLKAGGRIGTASALLGNLMKVTPVLTVKDGETATQAKVRTQKKALDAIVKQFSADIAAYGLKRVTIHYIGDAQPATAWAKEYIEPIASPDRMTILPVSPVVGLHVGPAIGVVYECEQPLPEKVSPDYPSLILQ